MYNKFLGTRNFEKDADRLITELTESFGPAFVLTEDVVATDTLITLNKNIPNVTAYNTFVVIDPFTIECEIRSVTAVVGNTYTIDALTYNHSAGDPVLYTEFPYCNAKWFGAKGDGSTDDLVAINRATTAAGETTGASIIVEFPPGVYLVSDCVHIPSKVIVRGSGPVARFGPPGTTIQASAAFPGSTPVVQLGDDETNSIYCRLENIGIDGNHYADIGVYSNSINEESGLILCTIVDCETHGIYMDNSTTGLLRNFILRDLYILNDNANNTAIGIYIHGGGAPQRGIDGMTVDGVDYATCVQLDGCFGAFFERLHLENAVDGILIGSVAACFDCVFIGTTGHSTLTDLFHIDDATTSQGLTFIGSYKNSATNNINDVVNGVTLTGNVVNHYTIGNLSVNGDIIVYSGSNIYNDAWQNYYTSSTVTGLNTLTITNIYYKRVGKLVFVVFNLLGTNDGSTITFTVPYAAATGSYMHLLMRVKDNGTFQTTPGWANLSGSTVTIYKNANSGTFTGSGAGGVQGEFFYEAS